MVVVVRDHISHILVQHREQGTKSSQTSEIHNMVQICCIVQTLGDESIGSKIWLQNHDYIALHSQSCRYLLFVLPSWRYKKYLTITYYHFKSVVQDLQEHLVIRLDTNICINKLLTWNYKPWNNRVTTTTNINSRNIYLSQVSHLSFLILENKTEESSNLLFIPTVFPFLLTQTHTFENNILLLTSWFEVLVRFFYWYTAQFLDEVLKYHLSCENIFTEPDHTTTRHSS